jgi:hypothetical protein
MTTEDPFPGEREMTFNYRYRLYLRPDAVGGEGSAEERLIYDSALDPELPLANLLDGMTDLKQLVRAVGPLPDGVHNLKLEVEDRAGNVSDDFLLNVTIDTTAPPTAVALLPSSDSGVLTADRVTNKSQPAFTGASEVGATVSLYANGEFVGRATVGSDDTHGLPNDGLGRWEITTEPLVDGQYGISVLIEDLAGNTARSDEQSVWIDTQAPNVPLLDLTTDTGLSAVDNITSDPTPTVTITAGPSQQGGRNAFPNEIRYRIYDRPGDGTGEVLLIDSFGAFGSLTPLSFFTETLPELADGVHNLKVTVEDRAGNVSHAFLLDVEIDTQPPTTSAPTLLPSSDTGMVADDLVTRIAQPTFGGSGSIGATVYVFANDRLIGQGQVGADSTDGIPNNGLGAWQATVEPLADGDHSVVIQLEDLAGNLVRSEPATVTIDTTRPNIPLLDLITDNGASPVDNVTNVSEPQFTVTLNDTVDGGANPFPHDVKFRLYDRTGSAPETLLYDSFVELGGFTTEGLVTITVPPLADGVHNLKLEVEDRAGNISLPFLLEVTIDTQPPVAGTVDLAEYSDSGMSSTDHVTRINAPALLGTGTIGDHVLIYANGQLIGEGLVQGDLSNGVLNDDLGAWEITVEPLDDGVYQMSAVFEDEAGNSASAPALMLEIDTLAPNTGALDLAESNDSGRHDDDNITNAAGLVLSATSSDLNATDHLELIPGGQNFKYRLYLRSEQGNETLVYDSVTDPALTNLLDGLTAATQITMPALELPEAWHNLKLEVEDRAGNISHDFLLDVLVDRTAYAGTAALHPGSDSGISDGVTNIRTPTFTGVAEANALVTITIDGTPAGTAVAIPLDGDDAVQPPNPPYEIYGNWTLTSAIALADGPHTVVVTYEDPAGNRATSELSLVIDTAGPQITNVTRNEPGFPSLFDPKPSSGPDPLIESIVIHVNDRLTDADDDDETEPVAGEEGNYRLVGDANGVIPITSVEVVLTDDETTQLILHFSDPLPDDRFTLTMLDNITDVAGNPLDGESGAGAPFEGNAGPNGPAPIFPSGDGVPGGDFVARFTVDSRPEVGTWAAGNIWIDTNGNMRFDPDNADYVNRDIVYKMGFTSDDVFAGNFALPGETSDGFDKLAVYGRAEGEFRWLVDTDNDGVPNIDRVEPQQVNGLPAAGRFDGNDANGAEVALFDGRYWYVDTNHDFQTDVKLRSFLVGYPLVGDFDGDGFDDLATWADNRYMIDLARGSLRGWDGVADREFTYGTIGVRERPVAADMDQDGHTDLGLWVPDREGVTDRDQSEWYFLISNGAPLLNRLSPPDDPLDSRPTIDFTPRPFGPDMYARFGDEFALPVVGNFDPPIRLLGAVDGSSDGGTESDEWTNPSNSLDVTGDGQISPLDALTIVNELNGGGARPLSAHAAGSPYLDVNGDRHVTALDALLILNELNRINHVQSQAANSVAAVAATAASPQDIAAATADQIFAEDVWVADECGPRKKPNS